MSSLKELPREWYKQVDWSGHPLSDIELFQDPDAKAYALKHRDDPPRAPLPDTSKQTPSGPQDWATLSFNRVVVHWFRITEKHAAALIHDGWMWGVACIRLDQIEYLRAPHRTFGESGERQWAAAVYRSFGQFRELEDAEEYLNKKMEDMAALRGGGVTTVRRYMEDEGAAKV